MICAGQPFVLLAEHTSCAESPPCTHIQCYYDIQCLLAGSLSPVIAGCRSPERDLFCICPTQPTFWRFSRNRMSNSTRILTDMMESTTAKSSSGPSPGQVAGIVCGVFAFVILLAAGGYFLLRFLRDRRKNHGEYRPQFEELHHAKDLPYLQPPAVEGLI